MLNSLNNVTTPTSMLVPKSIVLRSKPDVDEVTEWKNTRKEKAEIEAKEAKTFASSVHEMFSKLMPILKESGTNKKTWLSTAYAWAKTYLSDEWEYYSKDKYKNDADCQDHVHNKQLSYDTATMCRDVYNDKQTIVGGYKPFEKIEDTETGLKAVAYRKKNDIIIAYCGTNDEKDFISDMQLASGKIPEQFKEANNFYKSICKRNKDCAVMVTGHSLGGSLAELVASKNKTCFAITYNSFGVAKIIKANNKPRSPFNDYGNSLNYIIEGDPVSNSSKHVGKTTLMTKTALNNHSIANYISIWA